MIFRYGRLQPICINNEFWRKIKCTEMGFLMHPPLLIDDLFGDSCLRMFAYVNDFQRLSFSWRPPYHLWWQYLDVPAFVNQRCCLLKSFWGVLSPLNAYLYLLFIIHTKIFVWLSDAATGNYLLLLQHCPLSAIGYLDTSLVIC